MHLPNSESAAGQERGLSQLKIISRKDAKAAGLNRYFTGKPCLHGHITKRAVHNRTCIECRNIEHRRWNRSPAGRRSAKIWRDRNIERVRAFFKAWCVANPEKAKQYRLKHGDIYREKARHKYWLNPSASRRKCRVQHAKNVASLSDGYIRQLLCCGTILYSEDIPESLIKAKRQHILLQRELKQRKQRNGK